MHRSRARAMATAMVVLTCPALATAGEAIHRIEPTITPLAAAAADKAGADVQASRAAALPSVPGPLIVTHWHRTADGQVQTWCEVRHDQPIDRATLRAGLVEEEVR